MRLYRVSQIFHSGKMLQKTQSTWPARNILLMFNKHPSMMEPKAPVSLACVAETRASVHQFWLSQSMHDLPVDGHVVSL